MMLKKITCKAEVLFDRRESKRLIESKHTFNLKLNLSSIGKL